MHKSLRKSIFFANLTILQYEQKNTCLTIKKQIKKEEFILL